MAAQIVFPNEPVTFGEFFKLNNLDKIYLGPGYTFKLTGMHFHPATKTEVNHPGSRTAVNIARKLKISHVGDWDQYYPYQRVQGKSHENYDFNLFDVDDPSTEKIDAVNSKLTYARPITRGDDEGGSSMSYEQIITELEIEKDGNVIFSAKKNNFSGGKKYVKKELLGKLRCIYKIHGSRKEYVKHKGMLITVTDYKKQMKHK